MLQDIRDTRRANEPVQVTKIVVNLCEKLVASGYCAQVCRQVSSNNETKMKWQTEGIQAWICKTLSSFEKQTDSWSIAL